MSTYGLGAGEAIRLRLDDIEWHAMTIRITRPKTGVTIMLPLLSGVAEVLAEYLCKGRPKHAPTRHLFLSLHVPHRALGSSGPVRHIIMTHAKAAGTTAAYLGAHVLRHSCAVALLQAGTDITVIRDYLGHASIATTSHYAAANLAMKREVLEAFWDRAGLAPPRGTPWSPTPDLLAFLDSL